MRRRSLSWEINMGSQACAPIFSGHFPHHAGTASSYRRKTASLEDLGRFRRCWKVSTSSPSSPLKFSRCKCRCQRASSEQIQGMEGIGQQSPSLTLKFSRSSEMRNNYQNFSLQKGRAHVAVLTPGIDEMVYTTLAHLAVSALLALLIIWRTLSVLLG